MHQNKFKIVNRLCYLKKKNYAILSKLPEGPLGVLLLSS